LKDTIMDSITSKSVAVIVAHPDDETLWAGGTILSHPLWNFFVISLCRASDTDRAPKFSNALKILRAEGKIGDLDDGPDQLPLDDNEVDESILKILPQKHFDLIISHNPSGEYTRHLRHEEVSRAVIRLWTKGEISGNRLWTFAYEDGRKQYYPKPVESANIYRRLTKHIWLRKYRIITETYGFEKNGFEAETTPRAEAFWEFTNTNDAQKWLKNGGVLK
jgi:LmbE family N-acetylglucosaminyl deacetylase